MKQLFFLLLWVGVSLPLAAQTPNGQETLPKQDITVTKPVAPEQATAQQEAVTPEDSAQKTAEPSTAIETPNEKEATTSSEQPSEEFVVVRETVEEEDPEQEKVVYAPKSTRDPTLSPDDFLLLQYREQQRLAAIEAERKRKLEEERRRQEEAERLRQLELARIKDPTREVRNKIKIGGVIGQEVFIGSKIYTVGNTIFGARIVAVRPDEVVFSYKGHKFVRKVQL